MDADGDRFAERADFKRQVIGQYVEKVCGNCGVLSHAAVGIDAYDAQRFAHMVVARAAYKTFAAPFRREQQHMLPFFDAAGGIVGLFNDARKLMRKYERRLGAWMFTVIYRQIRSADAGMRNLNNRFTHAAFGHRYVHTFNGVRGCVDKSFHSILPPYNLTG
ncbi:hypothetical protein SDC9_144306 [bioreactor metagenome]|uniref:Uncharacterized protein n=1 Tax=bioreactor metagenome TaxID=1076179 RepID=A0A645E8K7_9ZZZZ